MTVYTIDTEPTFEARHLEAGSISVPKRAAVENNRRVVSGNVRVTEFMACAAVTAGRDFY